MKILVACEFSGTVKKAFAARGHEAYSCDLIPSKRSPENHLIGDVREFLTYKDWDILIAHPPCTYLAVSGARWFSDPERKKKQAEAIEFVKELWAAPIVKKCFENPVSILSTQWMKPSQIINPWQFGHCEKKRTCLWLDGLPLLQPTKIVTPMFNYIHSASPSATRQMDRSITYVGIANAMAAQWG